jgi:hypothetical protein
MPTLRKAARCKPAYVRYYDAIQSLKVIIAKKNKNSVFILNWLFHFEYFKHPVWRAVSDWATEKIAGDTLNGQSTPAIDTNS